MGRWKRPGLLVVIFPCLLECSLECFTDKFVVLEFS